MLNIVQGGAIGWVWDRFSDALRERYTGETIITPETTHGADRHLWMAPQFALNATREQLGRGTILVNHVDPQGPRSLQARLPLLKMAGRVLCTTRAMAKLLKKVGAKARYVKQGIDLDMFTPGLVRLPDGVLRVGVCGRNYPDGRKGPELMVAVEQALGCMHQVEFVFLGRWWEPVMQQIERCSEWIVNASKAATLDYSRYPAFYHHVDCLLVTSHIEGGPYPALEALASGCPVVSTPVGHCVDLVVPTQRPPIRIFTDPQGGASAVLDAYRNPPKGSDVRATVLDRAWPIVAKQWLDVIFEGEAY